MLLYVDDVVAIHHDATDLLQQLDVCFQMKPGSIGDPEVYLGAKVRKHTMENGVECWSLSSSRYVKEAVANAEAYHVKKYGKGFPGKISTPFPRLYRPELDVTEELDSEGASYYHSAIGILR